jgi:hypothetical protein
MSGIRTVVLKIAVAGCGENWLRSWSMTSHWWSLGVICAVHASRQRRRSCVRCGPESLTAGTACGGSVYTCCDVSVACCGSRVYGYLGARRRASSNNNSTIVHDLKTRCCTSKRATGVPRRANKCTSNSNLRVEIGGAHRPQK